MIANTPYGCQTYRDLLTMLQSMTNEQLDCTPTIYIPDFNTTIYGDEYYPVTTLMTASDNNQVLHVDHPYFSF